MITAIQPIEADGQFWIDISIDGRALNRRGPFATIDEVAAAATRLAAVCRGLLCQPVHIAPTAMAAPRQQGEAMADQLATAWRTRGTMVPIAAPTSSPTPAREKQHPTTRALRG